MKIKVESGNVKYNISINNKYTLIRGDSGTGKSTLIELINRSSRDPFINITTELRCVALGERESIQSLTNCIIFLDEDHPILEQNNVSKIFKNSNNLFVIISREISKYIVPLSVDSFCEMTYIDGVNYNKPLYDKNLCNINSTIDKVIIEDEGSGLEFIKILTGVSSDNTISSKGIRNLCNTIEKEEDLTHTLICYDTLASGWEQDVINDIVDKNRLSEVSWESFESYLLQQFEEYPVIDLNILKFNTKERFLTEELRKYCKRTFRIDYNKNNLPLELNPNYNDKVICDEFRKLQPTTNTTVKPTGIKAISF